MVIALLCSIKEARLLQGTLGLQWQLPRAAKTWAPPGSPSLLIAALQSASHKYPSISGAGESVGKIQPSWQGWGDIPLQ